MRKQMIAYSLVVLFAATSLCANSSNDPRMNWYKDGKFGLMIHWGMYAVPAGEWSKDETFKTWLNGDEKDLEPINGYAEQIMKNASITREEYSKIADVFDWSKWNAQDIIDLCYATGQRYIVITAKHHDGFAMYHSKTNKFNIVDATPYGRKSGRDPLKELADACHATETNGSPWPIKICFYYSHCVDWQEDGTHPHNYKYVKGPDAKLFQKYFENKFFPQVSELMHNYGDVGLIWFDVPRVPFSVEQAKQVVDMMKEAQPVTLVNGRLGKKEFVDYQVSGDNGVAGVPTDYYWETPSSINHTYGYSKNDTDWSSWQGLADLLVRSISNNGNYLLNIGPKGDGTVPEESVKILHQLGQWVKPNSEAIFGTRATPYQGESMTALDWGNCTQRDNTIYLFVKNWPDNGEIDLPLIKNEVKNISFLIANNKAKLAYERSTDRRGNKVITIQVPETAPLSEMVVIKVELEGKATLDPVKHFYDEKNQQVILEGKDFHAMTGQKTKICYDQELGSIFNFRQAGDAPVWTFEVPESGDYEMNVIYSAHRNLAKNKINDVEIDGQPRLRFTTESTQAPGSATDDWKNFKDHPIGTLSLEKGRRTLVISTQAKGWNVAIKRITLTHVK